MHMKKPPFSQQKGGLVLVATYSPATEASEIGYRRGPK
jgi:hypothetical protein